MVGIDRWRCMVTGGLAGGDCVATWTRAIDGHGRTNDGKRSTATGVDRQDVDGGLVCTPSSRRLLVATEAVLGLHNLVGD